MNRKGFPNEKRVVSEAGGTTPKVTELIRRAQNTRLFLRMATIELRRIAEQTPDVAAELRQVAQKIEAEATDLARDTGSGLDPAIRTEP